ncbi:MAG: GYDIA family GHMP kinase [Flavobacteriaceae bacterium]
MKFYSHGKVLLTAEYAVLEGVKALSLPTKRGQSLTVEYNKKETIEWLSYTDQNELWIDLTFDTAFNCMATNKTSQEHLVSVQALLSTLNKLVPGFYRNGITLTTSLEFPRDWGLGSSSTLINNLAQWLKINPYLLLEKTMGGSGYDIAAAQNDRPIYYERNGYTPKVTPVRFSPAFKEQLFFVHLNQKQNSRTAISNYQKQGILQPTDKDRLTVIGTEIAQTNNLTHFCALLKEHEEITAAFLNQTPVQQRLFPDFEGQIKSLGAWGGDFVLAAGNSPVKAYFQEKGFKTVIAYTDFILG